MPDAPAAERSIHQGSRPPESERTAPVWVYPVVTVFVWAVLLVLVLRFFGAFKVLLLGLLAAAGVAALLVPLVRALPGPRGLRAVIAAVGFALAVIGAVALLSWLLATRIRQEFQNWPQIREDLNQMLARWSSSLGLDEPLTLSMILTQVQEFLADGSSPIFSQAAGAVTGFLIALAFIFFGSLYLLTEEANRFMNPVLRLLPPRRRPQLRGALFDLEVKLRWWLFGTMISMTLVAATSWAGYAIAGVKFALPLALIAGLAEMVPTIGPLAAFVVALMVAATDGGGAVVGVVIVYCVIQTLESYVILPLVMQETVKIPPVVTLFSVIFWGKVFGFPGLLLAIPIDLVLWSLARHFLMRDEDRELPEARGAT